MRRWFLVLAAVTGLCAPAVHAAQTGKSPEAVAAVQAGLQELGYPAPNTGAWDAATQAAAGFLLEDLDIDFRTATTADDLVILRRVIEHQIARNDPARPAVFVASPPPNRTSRGYMLSGDGRIAITVEQESVILWNATEHRPIRTIVNKCCLAAADLSADGTLIAYVTTPSRVRVWDVEKGRMVAAFDLPKDDKDRRRDVTALKIAPSKDGLLVADNAGVITFHDLPGGKGRLIGNHIPPGADPSTYGVIPSIAISPDETRAASIAPYDGTVRIWNLKSAKLERKVKLFPDHRGIDSPEGHLDATQYAAKIAFDATGTGLVVVYVRGRSNGGAEIPTIQRIDVETGNVGTANPTVTGIALSADGSVLALSDGTNIGAFDAATLERLLLVPSTDILMAVDSTAKSGLVLHVSDDDWRSDGDFSFADLGSNKVVAAVFPKRVNGPTFELADDRAFLGLVGDNLIAASLVTGEILSQALTLPKQGGGDEDDFSVESLALVPSGALVDVAYAFVRTRDDDEDDPRRVVAIDRADGTVVVHDVKPLRPMEPGYGVTAGPFLSPDGSRVVTSFQREHDNKNAEALISIVDTNTGKETARFPFRPQTKGPIGMECTHFHDCQRRLTTNNYIMRSMFGVHASIAVSGSGKYALTGFWEPAISAIDLSTGKIAAVFDTSLTHQQIGLVNVGPGMEEKNGWNPDTATAVARGASVARAIAPVPGGDDFIAVLGAGPGSRCYMLRFAFGSKTPQAIIEIPAPVGTSLVAVVSPDGSMVAIGYDGGLILVLDANSGKVIATLVGNSGFAGWLAFSPDGRKLYSSAVAWFAGETADGEFRTWDIASGDLLATTYLVPDGDWLTITPEGFFTASPKGAAILSVRLGGLRTASIDQVKPDLERPDLVAAKLAGDPERKVAAAAAALDFAKLIAGQPSSEAPAQVVPAIAVVAPAVTDSAAAKPAASAPLALGGATHALVVAAQPRSSADGAAANTPALAPGTLVKVLSEKGGWSEIARAGSAVGFVPSASLAPVQ